MKRVRKFTFVEAVVVAVAVLIVAVLIWRTVSRKLTAKHAAECVGCINNLKLLSTELFLYANDNRGYMVAGFTEGSDSKVRHNSPALAPLLKAGSVEAKVLVCPGTENQAPTWQSLASAQDTNDAKDGTSYLYIGGLNLNELPPQQGILRDKNNNHCKYGRKTGHVILGDGSVKAKPALGKNPWYTQEDFFHATNTDNALWK